MFIGAVADDLTGATDLALMLSRGGMRVLQVVGVPREGIEFGDAEAVVVALKSRTIPAAEAVAQSVASARALLAAGARQLFFKYCSTFDSTDEGNIGPVTDALLDLLGETRTIACPAFPANKRTIYKGHLFVGDVLLSESSMRNHPLTPMQDANLVRVLQRQTRRPVSLIAHDAVIGAPETLERAIAGLEGIGIVDAITESDLRAIGRAVRSLKLVTGGSGIALGLPDNFRTAGAAAAPTAITPAPGRSVMLAGSCSLATRKQIETALAAGTPALQIDPMAIVSGALKVSDAVDFVLAAPAGRAPLIYSSADPDAVARVQGQLGRAESGEVVEHFLGAVARELLNRGVTRFLVAGGETSGAVVNALKVEALGIGPEIDPGVPWTLTRGAGKPIALALKSGNFGTEDFFIKAWDLVA
ncbi:MAG: type effector Hrp-dependent outer [Devosia sp.]|uniref:3-oxo-tetronate kinase n=1 Tax=Devosia sp. TaxID=1871048 RepID=UPI0026360033|nr:3-oxo-tetronate kinase [Devosia sp.]MDB5540813.1 type effector Hrp-dependent outer [Devosia sp.]